MENVMENVMVQHLPRSNGQPRPTQRPQTPVCPQCLGTGWEFLAPSQSVKRCPCVKERKNRALTAQAEIPPRFAGKTFADFQTADARQDTSVYLAKLTVSVFAQCYPQVSQGLLLMGTPGTGKTHLAVAALYSLMEKGVACKFIDFVALVEQLREAEHFKTEKKRSKVLQPVLETAVVLIDDFAAMGMSVAAQDAMSRVLNDRYNAKKLTLVTTNWFDPDVMPYPEQSLAERIGARLRSRLHEMCQTVALVGLDWRQNYRNGR